MPELVTAPKPEAVDNAPAILESRNNEKNRVKGILASASRFRTRLPDCMEEAQRAIDSDKSVDAFNNWLLERIEKVPEKSETVESAAETRDNTPIGTAIVRHPDFQAALKRGALSKGQRVSLSLDLPGVDVMKRATLTQAVSGLTKYERPPGIMELGVESLRVAQLFPQGQTEQTTIRFMVEDTFTNAATALAEEGTFPEMAWDLSEQDAPVRKCGVIARVTDEQASDSSQLEAYVNARVTYAVGILQDTHLLSGSGSSNQITGVLNTSGIQTVASGSYPTPIDAVFAAITAVRATGFFEPDYILMNPLDYQSFCLTKDSNGQYLFGGPAFGPYGVGGYSNVRIMWGLPVVSTTSQSRGTALIGSFRMGGQVWNRTGLTVEMTNSDASDFANGRIAIRATLRHALAIYRPKAFCTLTGIPA